MSVEATTLSAAAPSRPQRGVREARTFDVLSALARKLLPLAGIGLLLAVWQLLAASGLYTVDQLPGPLDALRASREVWAEGTLLPHVTASLARFGSAYFAAVAVAVPLGLVFGLRPNLWRAADPLIQVLRPISPVAWFPLAVLWLGIGNLPAIAIIFVAAFYPALLATVAAVRRVDPVYLKVARNFGTSGPQLIFKVIVPAAFPQIAMGLRIAVGAAWVYLVAGEMLGARTGLGFLIVDARNFLRTDLILMAMVLIGAIGFVIDRGVAWLERRLDARWGLLPEEHP
ncbi:MAG TPA: ABC transporter permease [Myxococcales bacterium]|nr:ABC transporter permease [Myxococcales bacterium]